MNDSFDILFETVRIGPVAAPNRFYQVPHCNGMGYRMPRAVAAMRAMKAEGGWGVICTEEVEIHHSSDLSPNNEGRLWDDHDIPALRRIVDAVHAHGALAGIELTHSGHHALNLISRVPALGPRSMGTDGGSGFNPGQTRRMDKEDIRNLRCWHRQAVLRAMRAGFDIIYCYAGHDLTLAMHFLLRRYNDRSDEYGGSLENRTRLLRELIEDTKEAVGDTCAVAVRLAIDELLGEDGLTSRGEGHDIVALLAELPDLWDVNLSDWSNDSASSRLEKEGFQEKYIGFVKSLTSKPVVGVGRYTTPDAMASVVSRGVMDLVGAARPSIADPFLPRKIREGRFEDIRECIGCNVCAASNVMSVPIRCTQNPTMGEEWRRGWHPESIPARKSNKSILVVGAGPAGMECARALGQRGYAVTLVDARRELGGRVHLESTLPGLSEWRRIIDWRMTQLQKMPNVSVFPESRMSTEDVLESDHTHVIIATGATWRRDGIGRTLWRPVSGHDLSHIFTPDDLLAGRLLSGRIVIYDDDHYYMAGVLAESLAVQGAQVTLVTPAPVVSYWTQYTLEQRRVERRLMDLDVRLCTRHTLSAIRSKAVTLSHMITGSQSKLACDSVVLVTDRLPEDSLYQALLPALVGKKIKSLRIIGDANAPNIIAQAVYAGHLAAREFDRPPSAGTPFRVERVGL